MRHVSREVETLGLAGGFIVWAFGFSLLYAAHGLACGLGVAHGHFDFATRAALVSLFFLFIGTNAGLAWWFLLRWRRTHEPSLRRLRLISFILAIAACVATIWTGIPVLMLRICE